MSYLFLCLNPILGAAGAIAMRKMKKMHELTVAFYCNLALIVLSIFLIIAVGSEDKTTFKGFNFWKDLDKWTLFLLMPLNSLSSILGMTTRFIAFKVYEPAKL